MSKSLAAMVGSRICHDLISPIGAIGNGVELLALTDGDTSAEVQLITESVQSANARIRFFRIAFGSASPDHKVSRSEVLSILAASALGGRFAYYWQAMGDPRRLDVRAAFLILQCFETAMPMGGDVNITCTDDKWTFEATGPRVLAAPALWDGLAALDADIDVTPAQVHFALLPAALAEAGRGIAITIRDNGITIEI